MVESDALAAGFVAFEIIAPGEGGDGTASGGEDHGFPVAVFVTAVGAHLHVVGRLRSEPREGMGGLSSHVNEVFLIVVHANLPGLGIGSPGDGGFVGSDVLV